MHSFQNFIVRLIPNSISSKSMMALFMIGLKWDFHVYYYIGISFFCLSSFDY